MTLSRSLYTTALIAMIACAACTSQAPKASGEGVHEVGQLRVTLDSGWYEQHGAELPRTRAHSTTWSRNGLDHDRLFVVAGVGDGESLFRASEYTGLPVFRPGMSATETADFVARSLQGVLWDGSASITASNARERGFTGVPGFEFEVSTQAPGAASHRGIAGGFVDDGRLYLAVYLAEAPEYFERNRESAQGVIDSLVPRTRTIQW